MKLSSAFATTVGLIVILGWLTGQTFWMTMLDGVVAMQFNTALCFALLGIAHFLTNTKFHRTKVFSFSTVFVISFITLLQYLFGFDAGLDQLFMKDWYQVDTSSPGRMAPNTALSFLMFSAGSFFLRYRRALHFLEFYIFMCIMIGCFSFLALVGYVSGTLSLISWGNATSMAVHTAFLFFILSVDAAFHVLIRIRKNNLDEILWITWKTETIIWVAVTMHLIWASGLFVENHSALVTPIVGNTFFENTQATAIWFVMVSLMATWGVLSRFQNFWVAYGMLLPQNFALLLSARTSIEAMVEGAYKDGYVAPHSFIINDQSIHVILAVFHIVALYRIAHHHFLDRKITGDTSG